MKKTFKNTIKKMSALLLSVIVILAFASCAKAYDNVAGDAGYGKGDYYTGGAPESSNTVLDENQENNRKIIKNVNESVQTDKYDDFLVALNEAVHSAGGYISSANYSGENYFNDTNLRHANLTVRIPADNLSSFTEKVDSLAVVTYYNESIKDVTTAYVDVESRIAVLEAEEAALLEILKTSTTTADALSVRTRLLDVQADLASLRAQKNSFDDKISYSTVDISVNEVRRAVEQNPSFFAEIGDTFSESLYDIGSGIRGFAVWFLGNILYILIVAAIAFGVFVLTRRILRRKNGNTKVEDGESENADEEQA